MRYRIGAAALAGVLALPLAPAPATGEDGVTTLLLTGDSVTQGSAGDWTWRYRLWKHFELTGTPVDFLGPRDDLYDFNHFAPGSYDYADPGFDRDHAAVWASSFTSPSYAVADLVTRFQPDVVVELLGINDLVGNLDQPQTVLAETADYVAQARSADPGVDVVLTALPQTWIVGAEDYNAGLPALAEVLSTPRSRIVVARAQPLTKFIDTWDPAHLSATGEVKVAAAVADALAVLGIGEPYPRPLPQVPNGPRRPASLRATAGADFADLSWVDPPGATGEYLWMRDVSVGEPWRQVGGPFEKPDTWRAEGLERGHDYEFRLQATKGTAVAADIFSNPVRITRPQPRVAAVQVISKRRALRLRWWPEWQVADDVKYLVSWWPAGRRERLRVRLTGHPRTVIHDLPAGHSYRLRVAALKDGVPGRGTRVLGITLG